MKIAKKKVRNLAHDLYVSAIDWTVRHRPINNILTTNKQNF
jgi:hypothetical protein